MQLSEAGHPKIPHTLLFPSALPRLSRDSKLCCKEVHHRLIFLREI